VTVSSAEAMTMASRLAREEGIFCGVSSGCNVVACLKVAARYPALRTIVTMINDNGLRYLSTELGGGQPAADVPERPHPPRAEDEAGLSRKRWVVSDGPRWTEHRRCPFPRSAITRRPVSRRRWTCCAVTFRTRRFWRAVRACSH